jgi:hypothetical protein
MTGKFQVWRCYNDNENMVDAYDEYDIAVALLIKCKMRDFADYTIKVRQDG